MTVNDKEMALNGKTVAVYFFKRRSARQSGIYLAMPFALCRKNGVGEYAGE
jgi:hypothetical protein